MPRGTWSRTINTTIGGNKIRYGPLARDFQFRSKGTFDTKPINKGFLKPYNIKENDHV